MQHYKFFKWERELLNTDGCNIGNLRARTEIILKATEKSLIKNILTGGEEN